MEILNAAANPLVFALLITFGFVISWMAKYLIGDAAPKLGFYLSCSALQMLSFLGPVWLSVTTLMLLTAIWCVLIFCWIQQDESYEHP